MIWNIFDTIYTRQSWHSLGIGRVKNAKHQLNHHAIEIQASPEKVFIQQTSICTSLAPHQFLQNMHTKTNPGQDNIKVRSSLSKLINVSVNYDNYTMVSSSNMLLFEENRALKAQHIKKNMHNFSPRDRGAFYQLHGNNERNKRYQSGKKYN